MSQIKGQHGWLAYGGGTQSESQVMPAQLSAPYVSLWGKETVNSDK